MVGCLDPDPRTAGQGIARVGESGTVVDLIESRACAGSLAGYLTRTRLGRPHVTLKLALSLDGCIALANGESQWITGAAARAHTHAMRARADAILVGGGTLRADQPRLDVRLPGLATRSPDRWVLTRGAAPPGWTAISSPADIAGRPEALSLFVEGGAQTAAAFLAADLVDRLLVYRAPIIIGGGLPGVAELGLTTLSAAHGRWAMIDRRTLGTDALEVYERRRNT